MRTGEVARNARGVALAAVRRYSAVCLWAAFTITFALSIPSTYLTTTTYRLVLSDQVVIGFLALAVLVPLTAGAFDLSVGAMVSFSLVMVTWLEANTQLNGLLDAVIAIVCCAGAGFINGFLVVRLRVNSFIATLGMSQVLAAISLYVSQNRQIVGAFSSTFASFGQDQFLGLTVDVYYLLALAVLLWYLLEHTPVGRFLFATGGNPEAARLSGVNTNRIVWGSLVASSVIAGLAGLVFAAKVGLYSNSFGPPLLFPAFAAVFFGSTQVKGRANVWGTLVALYTLAFGVKGLQLAFSASEFWVTPLFNGVALLVAVSLASYQRVRTIRMRVDDRPVPPGAPGVDAPVDDSRHAPVGGGT